ncbi:MAG: hypothetical protein HKN97_13090 [Myxococcales bacterium]|nr:hypothetical protein [Myxococcales bacterium]
MGTTKRRSALALATLLPVWAAAATADPSSDPAVIADAVRQLDADHDRAVAAVYVLQTGGEVAAKQIAAGWPTISRLGKTRALDALKRLALSHDAALDALIQAARSDDEDLRDKALQTLRQLGRRGERALAALIADPAVGDLAAQLLARADPDFALLPLLDAMAERDGANRPALRAALAVALQRSVRDPDAKLLAWLRKEPAVSAVASASMALIGLAAQRAPMTSFVAYGALRSEDFPSTWRLLQCAADAGPSGEIDRWVQSQVDGPEEWMLRQAAVEASAARGHRELARAALKDTSPRVRASAASVLSGDDGSMLERATLARRDPWPMVRAAAVSSLRNEGDALAVVVASVDDSMSQVRAAAIEVLTPSPHDEGWDRIHRRLRARDEWPRVTAAAIDYVVAHCRADAAEALFRVVMRAAPGNALTEDLNNAARAIEALRALGSQEALAIVEQLRGTEGLPPTLKMGLEQPLAEDSRCARTAP